MLIKLLKPFQGQLPTKFETIFASRKVYPTTQSQKKPYPNQAPAFKAGNDDDEDDDDDEDVRLDVLPVTPTTTAHQTSTKTTIYDHQHSQDQHTTGWDCTKTISK